MVLPPAEGETRAVPAVRAEAPGRVPPRRAVLGRAAPGVRAVPPHRAHVEAAAGPSRRAAPAPAAVPLPGPGGCPEAPPHQTPLSRGRGRAVPWGRVGQYE